MMKKIIALVLGMLWGGSVFAQQYSDEIESLQTAIDKAVAEEDFKVADSLKKQRGLYRDLEEAISSEDFARASEIKQQLNSNQSVNNTEKSLVYLFAGKYVGLVGGYVKLGGMDKVTLQSGEVKLQELQSGSWHFITNDSERTDEITRELEPGKIYFLEFSSKMGAVAFRPTLRFVDEDMFRSITKFSMEFPKDYEIADGHFEEATTVVNIISRFQCKRCLLEINGTTIKRGFDHKTAYEIHVPKGQIPFSIVEETKISYARPISLNQNIVDVEEETFLYIGASGGLRNFFFEEITKEEFLKKSAKCEKMNLDGVKLEEQ